MSCADCKHAEFVLTPTGRIGRLTAGRCRADIPMIPAMPSCVTIQEPKRQSIWPDMGEGCAFWLKKT